MFTGIFGASLGIAIQTKMRWLRILAPVVGLMLAITAHMLNNVLPLYTALVHAATGEAPPERQASLDTGFAEAFVSGSLFGLEIFLPFLLICAFCYGTAAYGNAA